MKSVWHEYTCADTRPSRANASDMPLDLPHLLLQLSQKQLRFPTPKGDHSLWRKMHQVASTKVVAAVGPVDHNSRPH